MAYAKAKPSIAHRAWSAARADLDWIAANYTSSGCDLWEEVRSQDFFWNRYTMRKALIQGADFARTVGGDASRATAYASTAKVVEQSLAAHVEADGYVFEATNRRKDTAVIEAFNVGAMNDGLFEPLSREVVATLIGLSNTFCTNFHINQQAANASIPGVLFGRYDGDHYAGGNPWVLLTASAANLLYRQAEASARGAAPGPQVAADLAKLLGRNVTAQNLLGAGDAILLLMKRYLVNGMHMNEQIDRNTGALLSAKDLTWNYANVLKAMQARGAAADALANTTVAAPS